MEVVIQSFIIFLHTLVAWLLVEWFFNRFHKLSRKAFVFWHYFVVFVAFFLIFILFFKFFAAVALFPATIIAIISILIIEIIVFKLLYSGELWFFNFVDWVVPFFIATIAVIVAGILFA